MSGGNSWTIVTSEESVTETLKPAGGEDHHEESHTNAKGSVETAGPPDGAEALHVNDDLASEEKPPGPGVGSGTDQHTGVSAAEAPPSCFEVSASLVHCDDEDDHAQVQPEQAHLSPDPDSYSDSCTHLAPSPDEPAALSTETLGSSEFSPEEELNGEKIHQDQEESDRNSSTADLGKQAEDAPDLAAADEKAEKTAGEGEPEVRKRRSLLAALEQIGQREEEEAEEEAYQLPQREDDSGFSVNKCILCAVILLGIGTIFFSGIFMDLDEESDYNARELKDAAAAGKQEWLNPEVPPHPADADSSEPLNSLTEGNEQIAVLQAQLQAQKEELKVALEHAAEGARERRQWEEVEKENSRLKTEVASLLVLQTENERMKRELESIPALQKEVETLRATVAELKLSSALHTGHNHVRPATSPPGGRSEDSRPESAASEVKQGRKQWDEGKEKKEMKRDKHDMGEKKDWKEREKHAWKEGEKRERKDGGRTERKKAVHEFDKEKEREGKQRREETKHWREKDWKKDKDRSGDEGKPWKNRDGKKEWREKNDREWKEEKERKKVKSEKVKEGKQWRGKGEDEWKSGKEWKKTKDGFKEGGKDRKEWKVKGEQKEWKNDRSKDQRREGKERGERKQWEGRKERPAKDGRKENEWRSKNEKPDKEWKKGGDWKRGGQKEKRHGGDEDGSEKDRAADRHLYGEQKQPHSHRKPSVDQPEYWAQQKDRLHHDPTPPQQCDSVEACAQQERLRPVPFAEFDAILQTYLAKVAEAGVDASRAQELLKLIPMFFRDGVFAHDKISFRDFVEDVGDILEDMVEVDEEDENDEEDGALEEELEEFEREVMTKFLAAGDKEKRNRGEWRKESVGGRG